MKLKELRKSLRKKQVLSLWLDSDSVEAKCMLDSMVL